MRKVNNSSNQKRQKHDRTDPGHEQSRHHHREVPRPDCTNERQHKLSNSERRLNEIDRVESLSRLQHANRRRGEQNERKRNRAQVDAQLGFAPQFDRHGQYVVDQVARKTGHDHTANQTHQQLDPGRNPVESAYPAFVAIGDRLCDGLGYRLSDTEIQNGEISDNYPDQ